MRRALLAALPFAVLALGCRRAPPLPKAFETRWMPQIASLSALGGTAKSENRFELGRFLVIETNDKYPEDGTRKMRASLIDDETVLTADAEKKKTLTQFLQAVYPNEAGGPTAFLGSAGIGAPTIETLDEYVASLARGEADNQKAWAQANPGKTYPFPAPDNGKLRAELREKLGRHDALILRYVHAADDK